MQKWEYLYVIARFEGDNWRPWQVGGKKLPRGYKGPVMGEYANQLGEQGWELVDIHYNPDTRDEGGLKHTATLVFKRPKE